MYVRRDRQRQGGRETETGNLSQLFYVYFMSIIIQNIIPFPPKTFSRDHGVTSRYVCVCIISNKWGLIGATSENLLMINLSQNREVAA